MSLGPSDMCNERNAKRLSKELLEVRETGAICEQIAFSPKPMILIQWSGEWTDNNFASALLFLADAIAEMQHGRNAYALVRCVDMQRLPTILQQGCDLEPPDSVLWADQFPTKAIEYGGDLKAMQVFDGHCTLPSYFEVAADTDKNQLDELRAVYPTVLKSEDGTMLWFSRLPKSDRRISSAYESNFARWIPGNPMDALQAIFVLGRELDVIQSFVNKCVKECKERHWR